MRKRVNLSILACLPVYTTQTGQGILTVDVHRAGATDTLSAGTAEGKRRVNFILNFDERIKNLCRRESAQVRVSEI